MNKKPEPDLPAMIRDRYAGMSLDELSEKYNRGRSTIQRLFTANKVIVKDMRRRERPKPKLAGNICESIGGWLHAGLNVSKLPQGKPRKVFNLIDEPRAYAPSNVWPDEHIEAIKNFLAGRKINKNSMTYDDLAFKLNCSPSSCRQKIKELGLE